MKKKMVLYFPATVVEQPVTYSLIRDYDLMINILKADINPKMEGRIVAEISGEEKNFHDGLEFLQSVGVRTFPLEQEIIWVEERCTHCGACAVICPAGALVVERPEMVVQFKSDKCIVCEHCITACPARAMEVCY